MNYHTLTISVAQLPIRLAFKGERLFSRIKKTYGRFLTAAPADLSLDVETIDPEKLRQSFGPGLRSPELFVSNEEGAFRGNLRLKDKKGRILVSKENSENFLSNFIRSLYCYLIYQSGGILLHAAVIIRKGKAWIFFGPSGSGKTTLTKLSKDHVVLNDDLAVVKNTKKQFSVFATPWADSNLKNHRPHKPFQVAGLFKLVQDKDVYLEKLGPATSVAEAFTYLVGIEKTPEIYTQLLTRYAELIRKVPCYRLHFRKDDSFWKEIDRVVN